MDLAVYNNDKLIFMGLHGCCVVENVGYKDAVLIYPNDDVIESYESFVREIKSCDNVKSKSGVVYVDSKVDYDSLKKYMSLNKGKAKLNVLFVSDDVYNEIKVDFVLYDRLICVGNECLKSVKGLRAIEIRKSDSDFKSTAEFVGVVIDTPEQYNLTSDDGSSAVDYRRRAEYLLNW